MDLDGFVETDSQHRVKMDDLSVRLKIYFVIKYSLYNIGYIIKVNLVKKVKSKTEK